MNRVFTYSLRLLLPALVSVTSSLHAEESEDVPTVDVDAILAAQGATVPTIVSQTKLFRASNSEAGDYFQAVAVSGDTVVVGAPFEDSNAEGVNSKKESNNSLVNSGAAYVYVRDGEKWVQQAYLKASNPGGNDQFGFSVAISGDTIAIGAFGEDAKSTTQTDNSAGNAGAVYIFTRKNKIWTQDAYLKPSSPKAGSLFGYSVALSGTSLVVGAAGEDGSASSDTGSSTNATTLSRAGAAYVFTRGTSSWSQQESLKASNPGANDLFGVSVGISGDTVVVGAQNESSKSTEINKGQDDDTQSSSGAAYVFVRAESKWSQQAYLKASNAQKNDLFGHSVAIDSRTIVVGAHQESSKAKGVNKSQSDNSAENSGAAYVFIRNGKTWSQQAYLKASNTEAGDGFGYSVAISGGSVVVGSYAEDSNARGVGGDQGNNSSANSGAAYLYNRSGTEWSQKSYLKASNTAANGQFGKFVAIYDDSAVIAAPGMSKYAGAAYLFEGSRAPSPEIAIDRELATTPVTYSNLSNGIGVDFGNHLLGSATTAKMKQTFRIRNTGNKNLTGVTVTKTGTDLASYELDQTGVTSTIQPGESKTFTVTLSTTATFSTSRVATITVASNDADESEFKISLTGQVLSDLQDKDGDKLNDWAESQYASLGFDWKTSNSALYETLMAGASAAHLYTTTEVQTAVRATTPVLTRDATTGKFTLQLSLEKSTDLKTFTPFPMSSGTFKDGKLEFEFTSPENASFYRVLGK